MCFSYYQCPSYSQSCCWCTKEYSLLGILLWLSSITKKNIALLDSYSCNLLWTVTNFLITCHGRHFIISFLPSLSFLIKLIFISVFHHSVPIFSVLHSILAWNSNRLRYGSIVARFKLIALVWKILLKFLCFSSAENNTIWNLSPGILAVFHGYRKVNSQWDTFSIYRLDPLPPLWKATRDTKAISKTSIFHLAYTSLNFSLLIVLFVLMFINGAYY